MDETTNADVDGSAASKENQAWETSRRHGSIETMNDEEVRKNTGMDGEDARQEHEVDEADEGVRCLGRTDENSGAIHVSRCQENALRVRAKVGGRGTKQRAKTRRGADAEKKLTHDVSFGADPWTGREQTRRNPCTACPWLDRVQYTCEKQSQGRE